MNMPPLAPPRSVFRDPLFVRNAIFGVEDSLVSTVGLLSGIASNSATHAAILSTGMIYICVEALSMAVGSFLSEESAEEFEGRGPGKSRRAAAGGAVMLVSFILAGLVPLIPYLLLSGTAALSTSIVVSLAVLLVLGSVSLPAGKGSRSAHAIRMAVLGGAAILVGVVVGSIFGAS